MKIKIDILNKKIFLIGFFCFAFVLQIFSQPPPPPPSTTAVPIEGGLFYLLVSGIAFTINQFKKNKKKLA